MSVLLLEAVTKRYPRTTEPAVKEVSLKVRQSEIYGLLGESGSGKTTILRLIAGFEVPTSGTIRLDSRAVASSKRFVPPEKRGVRMVFQESTLFPHLTVAENVRFGLRELEPEQRRHRVAEMLELVRLQSLWQRYPHELSGGQRQRVELAPALAPTPRLLLLDEPFSSLDQSLRSEVRFEVQQIIRRTGTTAILVTHDVSDAFAVCDRLAILRHGSVQQIGSTQEIYSEPRTPYVARLFGSTNLLRAKPVPGAWLTAVGPIADESGRQGGECLLSLRPDGLEVVGEDEPGVTAMVRFLTFLGRHLEVLVDVQVDEERRQSLILHLPPNSRLREGQTLRLRPKTGVAQVVQSDDDGLDS